MSEDQPFWEEAYEDPLADTFGPASPEILELAAALPATSHALDVGCGDGRNTLCLAKHGIAVDAFDKSSAAIRKLRSRVDKAPAPVHAWVQDIQTFSFRRDYDLIVLHGVLHLLERSTWTRLLESVRRHTHPGGWNVVAVFTDRLPPPPDLGAHMKGLFREDELRQLYTGWSVHSWEAYTLEDEHPGGVRHQHPVNKLVVRKP